MQHDYLIRCFLLACWTVYPYVSDSCCTGVWHVMNYRVLTQIHRDCHRSENKLGPCVLLSQLMAEKKEARRKQIEQHPEYLRVNLRHPQRCCH